MAEVEVVRGEGGQGGVGGSYEEGVRCVYIACMAGNEAL